MRSIRFSRFSKVLDWVLHFPRMHRSAHKHTDWWAPKARQSEEDLQGAARNPTATPVLLREVVLAGAKHVPAHRVEPGLPGCVAAAEGGLLRHSSRGCLVQGGGRLLHGATAAPVGAGLDEDAGQVRAAHGREAQTTPWCLDSHHHWHALPQGQGCHLGRAHAQLRAAGLPVLQATRDHRWSAKSFKNTGTSLKPDENLTKTCFLPF